MACPLDRCGMINSGVEVGAWVAGRPVGVSVGGSVVLVGLDVGPEVGTSVGLGNVGSTDGLLVAFVAVQPARAVAIKPKNMIKDMCLCMPMIS